MPKIKTSTVNLTPEDNADLDRLVQAHHPFLNRHLIHRLALRLGLSQLSKDPKWHGACFPTNVRTSTG